MKDISVIMPALNEETAVQDAVTGCLNAFGKQGLDGEVVVINDGSTDMTPVIVRSIMVSDGRVKLVEHTRPMGIGASFWDGVKAADGACVTMIPGDNENDPNEILRYTRLIDHVDAVVPYVVNKEVRPFFRNLVSGLFTRIINCTFGTAFRYTNGTVIYRRSVLGTIECKNNGFFYQAETLVKVARRGYLYAEVPYFLSRRTGGVSKAISFSSLKKVIGGYCSLVGDIYFSGRYSSKNSIPDKNSARTTRSLS